MTIPHDLPTCPHCDGVDINFRLEQTADLPDPLSGKPQWLAEIECSDCGRGVSVCATELTEASRTAYSSFYRTDREDPR